MSKFKKYISKINENIDKAQAYRNKMGIKTLAAWGVVGGAYFLHQYETLNWILYLIQFCAIIYSVYTFAVTLFISYVEFFIISKIEKVSFGGTITRMAVDAGRDMAVEKIRSIKDKKEDSSMQIDTKTPENKQDNIKEKQKVA